MPSLGSPRSRRFVTRFNAGVLAWRRSPRWGGALRRTLTIVRYTGRRSGREFAIPVGYRRRGDEVVIGVGMPDAKSWWRNFLGEGAPLTVELDGAERGGHAVAHRDDAGRVTVRVRLEFPRRAEVPAHLPE
ncbi:hypothetical protein [Isoptericola nanjingensis]|uniref:hypothetical protein n=1 Tax=Isoptericola TaxID=254250 RepID=UPI00379223F2|nr:hypothetical protein [Isoptericola sp. QY 916]